MIWFSNGWDHSYSQSLSPTIRKPGTQMSILAGTYYQGEKHSDFFLFFQYFANRYAESWVSKHHHTTTAATSGGITLQTGNEKKRKEKKRKHHHHHHHQHSRTSASSAAANSALNSAMLAPRYKLLS